MSTLANEIQSYMEKSGATMGVSVHHIESGEEININADAAYPMASVLKIPVLCEAFRQIHAGKFSLEDRWAVETDVKNIGSGILTYLQDGLAPTVRDLLTLMIIISDNTATDMVINAVGLDNINAFMRELGLTETHLPLSIHGLFVAMLGEEGADTARLFKDLDQQKEAPEMDRTGAAFSSGPENNVSTPRDMTRLLSMIYRGQVVNRAACDGMLHILLQQQLNARLPVFLPYGVPFAHKTGTLAGIRNDAGILYASDRSHVAVTVFSRWDTEAVEGDKVAEWERINGVDAAFGHIGRALYTHYAT